MIPTSFQSSYVVAGVPFVTVSFPDESVVVVTGVVTIVLTIGVVVVLV